MNRFWEQIIHPLIMLFQPRKIVEIGAYAGDNTIKILQYCTAAGSQLAVIDPAPAFDVDSIKGAYGDHFHMHRNLSLDALPHVSEYDMVLIDGDHNWYTVYHELKIIEAMALDHGTFPIVLLHDTAWPYARRDMYHDPQTIPALYRKPYAQKGIERGRSELLEEGGINFLQYNALFENGEKNGVLTAIEDFLQETKLKLRFYQIEEHDGLGILVPSHADHEASIEEIIRKSGL